MEYECKCPLNKGILTLENISDVCIQRAHSSVRVSLNSWSVSVALYYVSVSGDSLSGELHSLRMIIHSLSVSVSVLLEYRRIVLKSQILILSIFKK